MRPSHCPSWGSWHAILWRAESWAKFTSPHDRVLTVNTRSGTAPPCAPSLNAGPWKPAQSSKLAPQGKRTHSFFLGVAFGAQGIPLPGWPGVSRTARSSAATREVDPVKTRPGPLACTLRGTRLAVPCGLRSPESPQEDLGKAHVRGLMPWTGSQSPALLWSLCPTQPGPAPCRLWAERRTRFCCAHVRGHSEPLAIGFCAKGWGQEHKNGSVAATPKADGTFPSGAAMARGSVQPHRRPPRGTALPAFSSGSC